MFVELRHVQESNWLSARERNDEGGGTKMLAQEIDNGRFRFTSRVCDVSKIYEQGAPHARPGRSLPLYGILHERTVTTRHLLA